MHDAFFLIMSGDSELWGIIVRSLAFSAAAVLLSALPGIPAGVAIGWKPAGIRRWLASVVHALSALPTVVIGLVVYGFISRSGPLGFLGMLYTPAAVVTGQFFLALPLLVSFVASGFSKIDPRFRETLETHAVRPGKAFVLALKEGGSIISSHRRGGGRDDARWQHPRSNADHDYCDCARDGQRGIRGGNIARHCAFDYRAGDELLHQCAGW